jgi:hypothetical protein
MNQEQLFKIWVGPHLPQDTPSAVRPLSEGEAAANSTGVVPRTLPTLPTDGADRQG